MRISDWSSDVCSSDLPPHDLYALADEVFRRTFDVNCFGTWGLTKAAIPHLKRSDDGNVVTITSLAGVRPVGSSIAYAMSKAALNHMTVLLAKSHGPVRFNAVAPGLVDTPWTADWGPMHEAVAAMAPVPRSATPDDGRTEERRGGKEGVSTGRTRGRPEHKKKK